MQQNSVGGKVPVYCVSQTINVCLLLGFSALNVEQLSFHGGIK